MGRKQSEKRKAVQFANEQAVGCKAGYINVKYSKSFPASFIKTERLRVIKRAKNWDFKK